MECRVWKKILSALLFTAVLTPNYAQERSELRDSIRTITAMIEQHPDSVDLHLRKAALHVALDDWNFALDEYTIILNHYPDNPAALYYRAFVLGKMKRYAMARNDYEHYNRLVPHDFNAHIGLALINKKDGRDILAYDQVNNIIEMFPDSALTYAVRAEMMEERNMLEAAIYDYSMAIDRDPYNISFLEARANLYKRTKQSKKEREDREKLLYIYRMKHN